MIAVVLDCNVLLQAMLRDTSPAFACLEEIERRGARIQVSAAVLAEYRDVLHRDELRAKFPILTAEFVEERLGHFLTKSEFVNDVPTVFRHPRDPKDERYIDLALASGARYLASRDQDLLTLMQDKEFSARYPELTICDPVVFLTILKSI